MMNQSYEAIVIGAGPAGAMAARVLAEHNRKVLIIDKGSFPGREKACGGMLPFQLFRQYGLPEHTVESNLEEEIFVFPNGKRQKPQEIVTTQRRYFDAALMDQARENGAELFENTRVVKGMRSTGQNSVVVSGKAGAETYHTPLVIFADGALSLANKSFGIGFQPKKNNTCIGLEYALVAPENNFRKYWIFFDLLKMASYWSYAWVFPNRHTLNVGLFVPKGAMIANHNFNHLIEDLVSGDAAGEMSELIRGRKITKKIGTHIPMEVAKHFIADGAMVVGDAAGLVFPLTAGGIGTALWSGKLAGEHAARSLQAKDTSIKSLCDYEQEIKRSVIYRELKREGYLYKFHYYLGRINLFSYQKIFQLYKLKRELSLSQKIKVLVTG